jgi:hypothetical protein
VGNGDKRHSMKMRQKRARAKRKERLKQPRLVRLQKAADERRAALAKRQPVELPAPPAEESAPAEAEPAAAATE